MAVHHSVALPAQIPPDRDQTARWAKRVDPRRWRHALGAAQLAVELAARHGVSVRRAWIAGLLHDCARALPDAELVRILRVYRGRHADPVLRATPALRHNPAGAYLAFHRFGVRDPLVLRAIARHSIGGPDMTPLDQIVYIADYAEPFRTHASAAAVRRLAARDLNAAAERVHREKLAWLARRGERPHPHSLAWGPRRRVKARRGQA